MAVRHPIKDPIANAPPNIPTKFPRDLKKASALKPWSAYCPYFSIDLQT